jgi:exopolysaccharide production protein ExoZ
MRTIKSVQYLRAVAALMVLMFHALSRVGVGFEMGNAGVDIFFVISGFIMWMVSRRESAPGVFLSRRLIRIAPLYWGVTLLTAGCAILLPGKIFPNMTVTTAALIQSLLFIPHRDALGHVFPVVVPGWTLVYEMGFYLLFALCLLAPRAWRLWIMTGVMAVAVGLGLLFHSQNPALATYTAPIILEFVAGCWLAQAWEREFTAPALASLALMAAGVLALVVEAALGISVSPLARPLLWGLPAFAIVAGVVLLETKVTPPDWPLVKTVGDASYSIYLLHGFVVSLCFKLAGKAPAPLYLASVIVASCVIGYLSFVLFEKPASAWLKRFAPRTSIEPARA